jgi:hypothetical protein
VRSFAPRLIGFCAVHPQRDAGRIGSLVGRAVEVHGFRGIKVHGHDAQAGREVCEAARRYGVLVLADVVGRSAGWRCWPPVPGRDVRGAAPGRLLRRLVGAGAPGPAAPGAAQRLRRHVRACATSTCWSAPRESHPASSCSAPTVPSCTLAWSCTRSSSSSSPRRSSSRSWAARRSGCSASRRHPVPAVPHRPARTSGPQHRPEEAPVPTYDHASSTPGCEGCARRSEPGARAAPHCSRHRSPSPPGSCRSSGCPCCEDTAAPHPTWCSAGNAMPRRRASTSSSTCTATPAAEPG